jgi:hypothetical protein
MNRCSAFFVTAFAAVFACLCVGAPPARTQPGPFPRMTASHAVPQAYFSHLDPSRTPTESSGQHVGRFLSSTSIGGQLVEGQAFPDPTDPAYLYGIIPDGTAVRRISRSGIPIDTTSLADVFTRITGAWLVKSNVPNSPQWIPSGYDLADHYIVVGQLNGNNPALAGNTGGMMLINPATMAAYDIGLSNVFIDPNMLPEDVCFGVYPGLDGNYATPDDNQYRYVTIYSNGPFSGLYCLSLNKHETMNGTDPPPDWDPTPPTRGPSYTNAYPIMSSNSTADTEGLDSEDNGQHHCRSWFARPGIPNFGGQASRSYVIAGWVELLVTITGTNYYGPVIRGYTLGQADPIAPVTAATGPEGGVPPPDDNFGVLETTTNLFSSMTIVGDWLICGLGANGNPSFGANYQAVYLPEFLDGSSDGDNGVRAPFQPPGGVGRGGYHPNLGGYPVITYLGTAPGQSILYATNLAPFQNHLSGAGLLNNPTGIDMHTEEERMMGVNLRQAPQPFVGYWISDDPAATFPGASDSGGGSSGGGCSKSASGNAGTSSGLLGLMGVTYLVGLLLRETKPS